MEEDSQLPAPADVEDPMAVPQQLTEAAPESAAGAVQVSVSVRTKHAEGADALDEYGGRVRVPATPDHLPGPAP
eukprot:1372147-Prorocentrum_lima.AAC.1